MLMSTYREKRRRKIEAVTRRAYESGMPYPAKIAGSALGVGPGYISSVASRLGLTRDLIVFTDDDENRIRKMYSDYVPVTEIASAVGRSYMSVRQKIQNLGLKRDSGISKQMRRRSDRIDAVVRAGGEEAYRAKAKADAIAEKERHDRLTNGMVAALSFALDDYIREQCDTPEFKALSRDGQIRFKRAAGMTLAAIGDEHGMTRERVRQITKNIAIPNIHSILSCRPAAAPEASPIHERETV